MSTVLIIGDTHCPCMRNGYVDFLKRTSDKYSPDRIVHIGDLVDWHNISYHETEAGARGVEKEVGKARKQVQELHATFPEATWLIGNHDALPERRAQTHGLPVDLLKKPDEYWQVGWKVVNRMEHIKIDGVLYSHGETGPQGINAAINQAKNNFRSTVIGHLHGNAGVSWHCNPEFRVFGLAVGCGVDNSKLAMRYGRKFARKPVLGCGIVVDGKFPHFEPWILKSR